MGQARVWVLAVLASVVITTAACAQQLKLGDAAPGIQVSDWVKGEPVDLAKGKGKNAYLVEFWATWCPPCIESIPHLTELQHKYGSQGFRVVAISNPGRGETLKKVKRFVRKRGDGMDYTVAYDGASKTAERYMGGVGANGLPWAFLIDRSGVLVWHGHPGSPVMDEIVDQVVKGTFDASTVILQEKLMPMFERLNRYHMMQNWDAFKSMSKTILGIDPKNDSAMGALIYACVVETDDNAGLREFVEAHAAAHKDDPHVMNALAQALFGIADLDKRQPDLALRVAREGYKACKTGDCIMAGTYARALFEIGLVDRAIEVQQEAISRADSDKRRAALEKVKAYYVTCKALQSERP